MVGNGHGRYGFFLRQRYGLRGNTELWVMGSFPLRTNFEGAKIYGLLQSMGCHRYGLFQSRLYFKMLGGAALITALLCGVFTIIWGTLYQAPVAKLSGWIIVRILIIVNTPILIVGLQDFDGGFVGQTVVAELNAPSSVLGVTWTALPEALEKLLMQSGRRGLG